MYDGCDRRVAWGSWAFERSCAAEPCARERALPVLIAVLVAVSKPVAKVYGISRRVDARLFLLHRELYVMHHDGAHRAPEQNNRPDLHGEEPVVLSLLQGTKVRHGDAEGGGAGHVGDAIGGGVVGVARRKEHFEGGRGGGGGGGGGGEGVASAPVSGGRSGGAAAAAAASRPIDLTVLARRSCPSPPSTGRGLPVDTA